MRRTIQKTCDRVGQRDDMRSPTPKVAGRTTSPYRPEYALPIRSPSTMNNVTLIQSAPASHQVPTYQEKLLVDSRQGSDRWTTRSALKKDAARETPPPIENIPEQLANLIATMPLEDRGGDVSWEELAEAFLDAVDLPPVTQQSLSELDVESIIRNVRLRHDVNFDCDLSFRPNLDGARGQQKTRTAEMYWQALEAELVLYARLLNRSTAPEGVHSENLEALIHHSKRRIPLMFETIRDVLKSLVPVQDHARVDERLDLSMLMQEIERGVCDLVRLADWMAYLLKEHCAPMRDFLVNDMVITMRRGVARNSTREIVMALRKLLGVLEAMKLDVANHQIRSLKPMLIQETILFEDNYHRDSLKNPKARVKTDLTELWHSNALDKHRGYCLPRAQMPSNAHFESFVRATVAILFGKDGCSDFPATFYMDYDRLQALKAEINDLICIEACMNLFKSLVLRFGCHRQVSATAGQRLRASILAIMGDAIGHGPEQWVYNSESLSLEVLRQAACLADSAPRHLFDQLTSAHRELCHQFNNPSSSLVEHLESSFLSRILATTERHATSSPMELFTNLVPASPSTPSRRTCSSPPDVSDTSVFAHLLPETAKMTDLTNRITHILILHWRTWGPIAYIPEERAREFPEKFNLPVPSPSPSTLPKRPLPPAQDEPHVIPAMKTGDVPDTPDGCQDPHTAHRTRFQ